MLQKRKLRTLRENLPNNNVVHYSGTKQSFLHPLNFSKSLYSLLNRHQKLFFFAPTFKIVIKNQQLTMGRGEWGGDSEERGLQELL